MRQLGRMASILLRVPFDQYLRSVRALSREQFFHRATAAKVRAAQLQAQVANMAARSPHYGS